ncbi:MAG: rubredoxin, partial [Cyanobacteriota bacterium]
MSLPSSSEGPASVPPAAPVSGDGLPPPPTEASEVAHPAEGIPQPQGEAAGADGTEAEELVEDTTNHRFECRSCGYVYDPAEGVRTLGIAAGPPLEVLDPCRVRCPVCGSWVGAFR